MRRQLATYLTFFLLVSLALPCAAQTPAHKRWRQLKQEQSRLDDHVLQRWREEIRAIEELIREDRASKALKKGDRLASDMLQRIESGEGMGQWLGVAGLLRAVAAVQSGDRRLGLWHWHIALQMFPELADRDLSIYGETGEFLTRHPPRAGIQEPPPAGRLVVPFQAAGVTAPKKKHSPKPEFPSGKRGVTHEPVAVIVQAIIDETGRVRDPLILKSEGEFTFVCAALEAMWKWEFEPATSNGEPVAVWYNLVVNFRMSR